MTLDEAKEFLTHYICSCQYGTSPMDCDNPKCKFGMAIRILCDEEKTKGEWIEKVERRGCFAGDKTVYSYTCPFCGVKEFKKYPFCHCGADMREADNDD